MSRFNHFTDDEVAVLRRALHELDLDATGHRKEHEGLVAELHRRKDGFCESCNERPSVAYGLCVQCL